jgi:hypothetical protein
LRSSLQQQQQQEEEEEDVGKEEEEKEEKGHIKFRRNACVPCVALFLHHLACPSPPQSLTVKKMPAPPRQL